jgi:glucose-1-phosphate thymidylyltransferase
MKNNGIQFKPGEIKEWMDCGNKDATVHTNQRILEYHQNDQLISETAIIENSIIIPPCFIGKNAFVKDSIIGPHVSLGANSKIEKAIVSNSIIQQSASLKSITITNSMIGNHAYVKDVTVEINVGDFTQIDFDIKS